MRPRQPSSDLQNGPATAERAPTSRSDAGNQPDESRSTMFDDVLRERLQDSPLNVLLDTTGHSRQCLAQLRSGRSLSCRCESKSPRPDDAVIAIGLAIRFARIGAQRRIAIPRGVIAALVRQVDAGDPTATLVWQWLAARGQLDAAVSVRPALRVVCEETR